MEIWHWFVIGVGLLTAGVGLAGQQLETITDLDPDAYRAGLWFMAIGLGVTGVAGVIGPSYFRQVGSRLIEP